MSKARHNIIRLWKARLSNLRNSLLLSTNDFEKECISRRIDYTAPKLELIQSMSDDEFDARFIFGSEKLSEL